MTNPMIRIHNVTTDEVTDRAMNAAEFKQYEAEKLANEQANATAQAEAEANATAKAALLARLGITADEAKLLLG
jgi:hypothetical protein